MVGAAAAAIGAVVGAPVGAAVGAATNPCTTLAGIATGVAGFVATKNDRAMAINPIGADVQNKVQNLVAHRKANLDFQTIEADLKVIGDPEMSDPYGLAWKTISLLVINPYFLQNTGDGCPSWVASGSQSMSGSICNDILTNAAWFIKGGEQVIREGSFTNNPQNNITSR